MPSFFVPTPGDLTVQEPHPREFAIQGKKKQCPRRVGGEGACRWWN